MRITLYFMGQTRDAAGCERAAVEVAPPCTARDVLRAVAEQHGGALRGFLLDPDGQPRRSVLLVLRQRQVSVDGPELLDDGDCLTVLSPIAGG